MPRLNIMGKRGKGLKVATKAGKARVASSIKKMMGDVERKEWSRRAKAAHKRKPSYKKTPKAEIGSKPTGMRVPKISTTKPNLIGRRPYGSTTTATASKPKPRRSAIGKMKAATSYAKKRQGTNTTVGARRGTTSTATARRGTTSTATARRGNPNIAPKNTRR